MKQTVYGSETCTVKGCQRAAVHGSKFCAVHGTLASRLQRYPKSVLLSVSEAAGRRLLMVRKAWMRLLKAISRILSSPWFSPAPPLSKSAEGAEDVPGPAEIIVVHLNPDEVAGWPEEILTRYEVRGLLGVGGFGRVYLARDRSLGRTVAIKVLDSSFLSEDEILERFQNDARVLAQLSHANLVAVYDLVAGRYIVMEHIDGGSVRELLAANRKIALARAVQITGAVLSALQLAHDQGIIHRDIKPENVLLTRSGTPKLCDFGIAHVPKANVKTTYVHPGTAAYMSPEQVRGIQLDGRSDIYSVGALLYEMLAGDIYIDPANRGTPYAMASAVLNQDPRPLGSLLPSPAKLVDDIIKRMMAKDREGRYGSADKVRSALMGLGR